MEGQTRHRPKLTEETAGVVESTFFFAAYHDRLSIRLSALRTPREQCSADFVYLYECLAGRSRSGYLRRVGTRF